jgi:hypothetical protein
MTLPNCPVIVKLFSPAIGLASTKRMSPPVGVQANPTATPGKNSLQLFAQVVLALALGDLVLHL